MAKAKKKIIKRIAKTGVAAIPLDKGFDKIKSYFHFELERKDYSSFLKTHVKKNYSKKQITILNLFPSYIWEQHSHFAATAFCMDNNIEVPENYSSRLADYFRNKIVEGEPLYKESLTKKQTTKNVVTLSPQQRLYNKINNTIMADLDDLEDQWMNGEETTLDLYSRFKYHGLSGSATIPVRQVLDGWLLDYEDALFARCDQAVEGYSHLKKPELKRRIKSCQEMLLDLDKIKSAAKATRKIRIKKPRAADKQVQRIQYKKEDPNYKLASINPLLIVGSSIVYTFNTKYKYLTEYITNSSNGFEISGSTIKNVSSDSRRISLRKPDEVLPTVLNKSQTQIDKVWKTLTTKTSEPNGRVNVDTILLRVINK
tara:strand:+ start:2600 stop:3709 length:1110 start_codon:yes stop_codon:yes gene_type:complete